MLLATHVVFGRSNSSRGYVFSCLLPLLKDCLSQVDKAKSRFCKKKLVWV